MEQKVRLISISGQPLSGKSTVIDEIKAKLISKGIKEEDIHVVSVGQLFRKYFNNILDIVKNLKNPEEFEQLAAQYGIESPFIKPMAEAIKKLSKAGFDFEHYDIEQANNNEALKEIRDIIDTIVDERTTKLGEQALKRNNPEEVWIFDSRLAFKMIPESFAVRLTVRDDIAGKRLMGDTRKRGKEDNNYQNEEEATQKVIKRAQGEEERYKERYGVELSNEGNYNLIIDTSFSEVSEIADVILKCEELERKGIKYYPNWTSPKTLLPTQPLGETLDGEGNEEYLEYLRESISKYGYDPSEPIKIFEYSGRKYLDDGNHRVIVMAELGKTLIEYFKMPYKNSTCEAYSEQMTLDKLIGFSIFFRKKEEDFSYEKIYPGIVDIATKNYEEERYYAQYIRMIKEKGDIEKYNEAMQKLEEMKIMVKGEIKIEDKTEEER